MFALFQNKTHDLHFEKKNGNRTKSLGTPKNLFILIRDKNTAKTLFWYGRPTLEHPEKNMRLAFIRSYMGNGASTNHILLL